MPDLVIRHIDKLASHIKIVSGLDIAEKRVPQDGNDQIGRAHV